MSHLFSLLLGLCCFPSLLWASPPLSRPIVGEAKDEYGLYPSHVEFVPACRDKPKAPNCSEYAPSLLVKGDFLDDDGYVDESSGWRNLFGENDKEPEVWIGVWLEGEAKVHRFRVKGKFWNTDGKNIMALKGTLTIKESADFLFSENGVQTKTLKLSLLSQDNLPVLWPRIINPSTKTFRKRKRPFNRPTSYYTDNRPPAQQKLPDPGKYPTDRLSLTIVQKDCPAPLTNKQEKAPPSPTPSSLTPPAFLIEHWLKSHPGELFAAQLSTFFLLGLTLLLRRVRYVWRLMHLMMLGSAALGALVFLGVARQLPEYAHDLTMGSPRNSLVSGAWFGLMLGSLLSPWLTNRLLAQQTPSLDLKERQLFWTAGWLSLSALAALFWVGNQWLFGGLCFAVTVYLCISLLLSHRRLKWFDAVKAGKIPGLVLAPKKEHPSEKPLVPVFYHSEYGELDDLVVLRASAQLDPYRGQQEPLWLTSLPQQNYAAFRVAVCIISLTLIGFSVICIVLLSL
jgi:hypothetical protein